MIGTTIAHYQITEKIGQGGMGEVYRATDTKLNRDVALKILPEEFAADAQRMGRFQREAEVLASLDHPNIGQIYGVEESDGTKALVLQLIEGPTLADRIAQGPIPVEEALKIALQIAEGLGAAHEKGVIHRDLKPANIKITPDGQVKILDFGLAKAMEGDPASPGMSQSPTLSMQATQAGVILGTAAYMSPEQTRGREIDKRTDIWAFGCILYEMLTGHSAFEGEDVTEILASVIKTSPNMELLSTHVPPAISRVLSRCLQKDTKKRFRDIGDVQFELEEVLANPSVGLVQPVADVAIPQSKLPWFAAIALCLIVGVVVWNLKPQPSLVSATVGRFPFVLPDGQSITNRGVSTVAVSRDGTRIAYAANNQLHLRELAELESRPIHGTGGNPGGNPAVPTFSPDGQSIAYWAIRERQLRRIAISGGASVTILSDFVGAWGLNWHLDDTLVYAQPEGIMRVSANGGTPELLIEVKEGEVVDSPQHMPGSEWVLFSTTSATGANRWNEAQVVVQSLQSGERKVLVSGGADARYVPTGHLIYALDDVLLAVPFDLDSLEVTGGPVPVVEGVRRADNPAIRSTTAHYGFSDSGTLIYLHGGVFLSNLVLGLADRNGIVETLNIPPNQYLSPRFSPDGHRLAVQTDGADGSNIWVYDLSGDTQIRQLTQGGINIRPLWTPDGERVTFASDRGGTMSIYWQPADGSGVAEQLTTAEDGTQHHPESWSPDGRKLTFGAFANGGNSIWMLSLDEGSEPELFYDVPGSLQHGSAFSPDGKWLAYWSGEGGSNEVYVQPFPAVPGVRHRITRKSGAMPMWSPNGSELFYRPSPAGLAILNAVDIVTEPAFSVTSERTLPIEGFNVVPNHRDYDITPDGERFLMVFPEGDTDSGEPLRQQINIVLNWFEELKRLVPTN